MKRKIVIAVTAAALLSSVLTACSSSSSEPSSNGSSQPSASAAPIKLGVLTDTTGVASSGFTSTEKGIKAYVNTLNAAGGVNGQKITYVMGDTLSTPAGALTAAQKLVQTDRVFAIIDVTSVLFGAEPFLLKSGIPVIGGAFDGPEWTIKSNTNLFASVGVTDYTKVSSATGLYLKARGVSSCAAIGYASSKSSQASASGEMKSCQAAGLKVGYLNNQVPFGSTDMGAVALAMKAAGVDGITMPVVPNTAFALAAALRQLGVTPKSFLLATGYGGDLLASSAAVTAAQGYEFTSVGSPIEAKTPATEKFAASLASVGVTGPPTFAEQEAYVAMAAFVAGMKAAGPNPSQKAFMTAMRGVKGFDAEGLFAPGKVDFDNYAQQGTGGGQGGCLFVAQLKGTTFTPIAGTPVCGKTLEGVSAS